MCYKIITGQCESRDDHRKPHVVYLVLVLSMAISAAVIRVYVILKK